MMVLPQPDITLLDGHVLLENLDSALVVVDQAHEIQYVNVAAETLLARSRRYLLNSTISSALSIELANYIDDCFNNNAHFTLREVVLDIDEVETLVDVTLQCVVLEVDQPNVVLIEINSINRISRFMREKNQLERQQSFRMMMRGLAHEIKNPLGGIRGAAQLLDREIKDPARKELTSILIKEADRLTRLVDRVMGSRELLKPIQLNIHEVLEHVIHLVSVRAQSSMLINRFYDPALPEIRVDREQMIQAVLNIVVNAIEAQQNKDSIVIGLVTEFDRFVTINRITFRQVLKIKIWDEGDGVPDALQEIVFDPLITSRPEGTGLGLSITQEIVQRHKGIVQLEQYEHKTCFVIYLPYLNEDLTHEDESLGDQHE